MKQRLLPYHPIFIAILLALSMLFMSLRLMRASTENLANSRLDTAITLLAATQYDRLHNGARSSRGWSAFAGQGVSSLFGDFTHQALDLGLSGRGLSIEFARTYHSALVADGPLGPGWTHSYALKWTQPDTDTIQIQMPDGRFDRYTRQGNQYVPPPGVYHTLVAHLDGTVTLERKDQTRFEFDALGRLVNIVDRNQNQIALTYNTQGELATIVDTVGRVFSLTYNAAGHLETITDPALRVVQYSYNNGRLSQVTSPAGEKTSFAYNPAGLLTTVYDNGSRAQLTNEYDAQGRVLTQTDVLGNQTTFVYTYTAGQTAVTDPRGAVTAFEFDDSFRLSRVTDALGYTINPVYDAHNNLTQITDKRGGTSQYTYDAWGNVTAVADALGQTTVVVYDTRHLPVLIIDALGRKTRLVYDAQGNLTKLTDAAEFVTEFTYDMYGQPMQITDANGNTVTMTHDSLGNLSQMADPLQQLTTFNYDAAGRLTYLIGADGGQTQYAYDANNRPLRLNDPLNQTSSIAYDPYGNLQSMTDPLTRTTSHTYNARNELILATDPAGGTMAYDYDANGNLIQATDSLSHTTVYTYNLLNQQTAMRDPDGNVTQFAYDANGNMTTLTDTLGFATHYTYDALNRVTAVQDPLGHTQTMTYDAVGNTTAETDKRGFTTQYSYDLLDRLISVTDPMTNTVAYVYDNVGNRTAVINANNTATQYIYNANNQVVVIEDPLGNKTLFEYDEMGNLLTKTDANGQAVSYEYDLLGRTVQIGYPDNTISYEYDAFGNRTHVIDIQGVTLYEYDALNRVKQVTQPGGQIVGYTYDPLSRLTQLTYPTGDVVSYTYNFRGQLTHVTDWDGNATSYQYNALGFLSDISYPNNTSTEYFYDAVGRLKDIHHLDPTSNVVLLIHYELDANGNRISMADNRGTESYIYDDLNRLARVTYADGEMVAYTYDGMGNRLAMDSNTQGLTTYNYDDADRLLSLTMPDSSVVSFTWDNNGNMTSKGATEYFYDSSNRLTQVISGTEVIQFTYDGDGNRLSKVVNGLPTNYTTDLVSSLPRVLMTSEEGQDVAYTYGHGLNSVEETNDWHFYHADGLGSVRQLSDAVGNIAGSYDYDVFGSIRGQMGTSVNIFGFTGEQFDSETGLIFLRARYYDPRIGIFLSRDPVKGINTNITSHNPYVYAHANPVNFVDPTGLFFNDLRKAVSGATSSVVSAGRSAWNIGENIYKRTEYVMDSNGGVGGWLGGKFTEIGECVWKGGILGQTSYYNKDAQQCSKGAQVGRIVGGSLWTPAGVVFNAVDYITTGDQFAAIDLVAELALGPALGIKITDMPIWKLKDEIQNFSSIYDVFNDSNMPTQGKSSPHFSSNSYQFSYNQPSLSTDYQETRKNYSNALSDFLSQQAHNANNGSIGNVITYPEPSYQGPRHSVFIESPIESEALKSSHVQLRAISTGAVTKVEFIAHYATDPNNINSTAWHHICWAQRQGDTWTCDWDLTAVPDQYNPGWGTVGIEANYYTCDTCLFKGDRVNVGIDRGPLTWEFNHDNEGWTLLHGDHSGFDGRSWKFEPGSDPWLQSPAIAQGADKYNAVQVVMDSKAVNTNGRVYFTTITSPGYSESKSVPFTLLPNNEYRLYTIYMGNNPEWQGTITGLRLDPVETGDADRSIDFVFIDNIRFLQLDGFATTNWFPDGTLVKASNETVYLLENGQKRAIPSADIFQSCGFNWNHIVNVTDTRIDTYPDGAWVDFCDGALLKGSREIVYALDNGTRRPFCSGAVFTDMGYQWDAIQIVPDAELSQIPSGTDLCTGWTTHPDGTFVQTAGGTTVYLLENGEKRPFADAETFTSWGGQWSHVATISQSELNSYPTGSMMSFRDGVLVKGSSAAVYLIENGQRRLISGPAVFEDFGYQWGNVLSVSDATLNAVPQGSILASDPLAVKTSLTITPDYPAINNPATARFTLINTGNKPITIQSLRANIPSAAFSSQSVSQVQPGATVVYSQTRSFSTLGTYQAEAQYQQEGIWQPLRPASPGIVTKAGLTVMMMAQPTINPISNSNQDGTFSITWSAVNGATRYVLEEDDNPQFSSPQVIYSGSLNQTSISGHVPGTFSYRVRTTLPYESGWSTPKQTIVQGIPVYLGWHPDGSLLKRGSSDPSVMLLENGIRRPFPNQSVYFSHYPDWEPVVPVQVVEYDQYPAGSMMTFRDGTVVKTASSSIVYIIDNNIKHPFCTAETYEALGYTWNTILEVPTSDLPSQTGSEVCLRLIGFEGALVRSASNTTVYLIENGKKRPFTSNNAFISHGFKEGHIAITADLAGFPTGTNLGLRDGTIITCDNNPGAYFVMENGKKRGFATGNAFTGQGYDWGDNMIIPASECNAIPNGANIEDTTKHVNGAFVKYDNSSIIYMVVNGQKRPFTTDASLWSYWLNANQNWDNTLIASVDSANYWRLNQLPTGAAMPFRDGTLVKSSTNTYYATEAGQKRRFLSTNALNALGYQTSDAILVSSTILNAMTNGANIALKSLLTDGSLLRDSTGTVWRLEDGKKRGFGTWEIYLSWGYQSSSFATFPDAELNTIATHTTEFIFRDGTILKGQNGTEVYFVEHGQRRAFPTPEVYLEYGYGWSDIQIVPDSQLALVPSGPDMDVGSPAPVSVVINGGAQYTNDSNVTIRVHATDFSSGVRYVKLSNNNWATQTTRDLSPAEGDFYRDIPWSLGNSGDGLKQVWVQFCDAQNYCSGLHEIPPAQIMLETTPPGAAFTAPLTGTLVRDTVLLQVDAQDNGSGIQYVEFKAHYDDAWHTINKDYLSPYEFTWDASGVSDQANILLGGDVVDNFNRVGTITAVSVTKDATPPQSSNLDAVEQTAPAPLLMNSMQSIDSYASSSVSVFVNDEYVRDHVVLTIDADDNVSGISTVTFEGFYDNAWHTIGSATTPPYELVWDLTGIADQDLLARAIVPDNSGNSQIQTEIRLVKDNIPPEIVSSIEPDGWSGPYTNDTTPAFKWAAATDDRSGIGGYILVLDEWTPGFDNWSVTPVTSWSITQTLTDGSYTLAIASLDKAGNVNPANTNQQGDAPYYQFTVDTVLPTSAVTPLAAVQSTSLFTVAWSGQDDVAGVARYDIQFKDGNGPWLNWLVGTDKTSATFHGTNGHSYAFRSQAHDAAGNIETSHTQADTTTNVTVSSTPPAAIHDLTLLQANSDGILNWSPVTTDASGNPVGVDFYKIYLSTEPYFMPASSNFYGIAVNNQFDLATVSENMTSAYFIVTAVSEAGQESVISNRVGKFVFPIRLGN